MTAPFIDLTVHHKPVDLRDRIALGFTKVLRFCADTFFALYLLSPKTAHRIVGYFEEEAVISYTLYLKEIDDGRSANVPAPEIAKRYWGLADDARLRDVVLVVRADEAHHRDVNHGYADELDGKIVDASRHAPCPPHVEGIHLAA